MYARFGTGIISYSATQFVRTAQQKIPSLIGSSISFSKRLPDQFTAMVAAYVML